MSSTEPPSRIPFRGHSHVSKTNREELESKGKVEKVREVDADETRKRKFQKYYNKDESEPVEEEHPSPFALPQQLADSGLGSIDEAMNPSFQSPPDLSSMDMGNDDDAREDALPQSEQFWDDIDFPPDQPTPAKSFQETSKHTPPTSTSQKAKGKQEAPLPSKVTIKPPVKKQEIVTQVHAKVPAQKGKSVEKQKLPSPFDTVAMNTKPPEKEGKPVPIKKGTVPKEEEELIVYQKPSETPLTQERRDTDSGSREQGQKNVEIQIPSMTGVQPQALPVATAATTQAMPYLTPASMPLFFQMVGTIYVMTGTQGVNRTEIVLNNPSFADSKFFGATIRIDKYATAPDSFNITLTGTNEAVQGFRENIPSLMAAFQNGNFTFKVNRIDVHFFRRKERGDGQGDEDLGERKK